MASMGRPGTKVSDLCGELGITRQTLYRHVSPTGELRADGEKLLSRWTTRSGGCEAALRLGSSIFR
jgi:transposase-like protein